MTTNTQNTQQQPTVQELAIRPVPGVEGETFSNCRQRGYTEQLSLLPANRGRLVAYVKPGASRQVREAVMQVLHGRARVI